MSALIAVDIGGTTMRAASYPTTGVKPLEISKIHWSNSTDSIFNTLHNLIQSVWVGNDEVLALSIATPGPIEPESGFIYKAPNIPGWTQFPLGEELRKIYSIPVYFGNDANFAAFGEWKYGAGTNHSNLIYLTISTGIGGGIICNDQLVTGQNGLAAEFGHVMVQPGGPVCSCGKKGHLEAMASGPAIVDFIKIQIKEGRSSSLQIISDLSASDVSNAARQGDDLAIQAINRAGDYLGIALASFIHIFNPSIVILGGGVSKCGKLLTDPMTQRLENEVIDPIYLSNLDIVPSEFGDDSGLLGALAFARHELKLA